MQFGFKDQTQFDERLIRPFRPIGEGGTRAFVILMHSHNTLSNIWYIDILFFFSLSQAAPLEAAAFNLKLLNVQIYYRFLKLPACQYDIISLDIK